MVNRQISDIHAHAVASGLTLFRSIRNRSVVDTSDSSTKRASQRRGISSNRSALVSCSAAAALHRANALKAIKGEILSMDNPMTRNRSSSLERFHCFQELDSTCPRRPSGELDLTRVVTFSQVRVKRGVLRNMASQAVASLEPAGHTWLGKSSAITRGTTNEKEPRH